MKKMQGNFLTSKKFDKEKLIQLIEANQHVISENDSLELKEILSDFKNNDFSLLTPQEIQFIENSNDDIITKYLIFRHKFKKIPKLHIDSDSPQHLIIEPVSACNLRCVMCYQIDEKFSGMINALSYGAPPHGGIAPGIDRIVMLLAGEKNIREVTMFPMNQNAQDLMMSAPSSVSEEQLKELNLTIKKK